MREHKLISGVKWHKELQQIGINHIAVKEGLGVLTFPETNTE
jgi:hypothetical protein